jgi:hypothetical protein
VHNKIKDSIKDLDYDTENIYNNPNAPLSEKVYQNTLRNYVRNLYATVRDKKFVFEADEKKIYIHMSRIIDCLNIDEVFQYEKDGVVFNFRNYYNESLRVPIEEVKKEVHRKLNLI